MQINFFLSTFILYAWMIFVFAAKDFFVFQIKLKMKFQ